MFLRSPAHSCYPSRTPLLGPFPPQGCPSSPTRAQTQTRLQSSLMLHQLHRYHPQDPTGTIRTFTKSLHRNTNTLRLHQVVGTPYLHTYIESPTTFSPSSISLCLNSRSTSFPDSATGLGLPPCLRGCTGPFSYGLFLSKVFTIGRVFGVGQMGRHREHLP